jgi:glycosyltransferase involved in cell wall biosynthesis
MEDRLAILMATCQGEVYLGQQILSLEQQTFKGWSLYVSDDGSTDATLEILADWQRRLGHDRLTLSQGPQRGFAANYFSLVCAPDIEADYFAFCDQDDIWASDKLQQALSWLRTVPAETPALYCGRAELVDATGTRLGLSSAHVQPPSFANALVQNIAGGNTMIFNRTARNLISQTGRFADIPAHDWWAYLVVTACGGRVRYDPVPHIRYRQHETNAIGARGGPKVAYSRVRAWLGGQFSDWIDGNLGGLQALSMHLSNDSLKPMNAFIYARGAHTGWQRWRGIRKSGVYRQTIAGNATLALAALLGRI